MPWPRTIRFRVADRPPPAGPPQGWELPEASNELREHPGTGVRMRASQVHCVPCGRDISPRLWWLHAWAIHGRRPWRRYA